MELICRLVISFLILVACSSEKPSEKTRYFDEIGREVYLSGTPSRLVSMAPNITEILFAIGAGNRLVGITDYCNYPAETEQIEKIGGIINPAIEKIITLKPDLVLATADGNPRTLVERMDAAGIPVYVINPQSVKDIYLTLGHVGTITGHFAAADSVIQSMKNDLVEMANYSSPTVFMVMSVDPLISVSTGSYLDDLVSYTGLRNVVPAQENRYPTINPEALFVMNPDYLLVTNGFQLPPGHRFEQLPAVQAGNILTVDADPFLRPGPRIAEAVRQIRSQLP